MKFRTLKLTCIFFITFFFHQSLTTQSQPMSWDWVLATGGNKYQLGETIAVDEQGNMYVAGAYQNWLFIEDSGFTHELLPYGGSDIYLCRYLPNGKLDWVVGAGCIFDDMVGGLALDAEGNVFITGSFSNEMILGSGTGTITLQSFAGEDAFVAKYSRDGDLLFAFSIAGEVNLNGCAIATDASNNFFVAGAFYQTAYFGDGIAVLSRGEMDIFLAAYNSFGELLWVTSGGGVGFDEPVSVVCDSSGNIILTGAFSENAIFGEQGNIISLQSRGEFDMFLSKYNPNGNLQWALSGGSNAWDTGKGLAVDEFHNIYVGGFFEEEMILGTPPNDTSIISYGSVDGFVAKYDTSGILQWAFGDGGTGYDEVSCLAADQYGRLYCTGSFTGIAEFGNPDNHQSFQSIGTRDIFVTKYFYDGSFNWATANGSLQYDQGEALGTDNQGHVYVTGGLGGNAEFDDIMIETGGQSDILVGKLSNPAAFISNEQNVKGDLHIYPNPSNGVFYLAVAESGLKIENVTVQDALGRLVPIELSNGKEDKIFQVVLFQTDSKQLFIIVETSKGNLVSKLVLK